MTQATPKRSPYAEPARTTGRRGSGAASLPNQATTIGVGQDAPVPVLLAASEQFANRLKKNARMRRKWARREGVSCYRVYDADLPDYAAAIDLYEGEDRSSMPGRGLVVAEYAAPSTVDAETPNSRATWRAESP